MSMKRTLAAAVLVAAASLFFSQPGRVGAVQKGGDEQAVRQLVDEVAAAVGRNDTAALDRIYADSFTFVSDSGALLTKAQRLAAMKSGELKYESVTFDEVNVRLYYIKEATQWIKKVGAKPDRFDSPEAALAELDEQFDAKELVYDKGDVKEIEAIYEANATGPSVATDEERRFARILNDYRVMLGLEALRLDDALVLAARKHSQEMNDLDYFDNSTLFIFGSDVGVSQDVSDNLAIGAETGLRYQPGLSPVPILRGTGLEAINDTGSRWSLPISAFLTWRF